MFFSTPILASAMLLLVGQALAQELDTNTTDGGVLVNVAFNLTDDQIGTNSSVITTPPPAPPALIMPTTDTPSIAPTPFSTDMDVTFAPFPTVLIPPQAPQSRPPATLLASGISDFPSTTPSQEPLFVILPATCSSYPACSNLTGDCCPTTNNVLLDCCGVASVEETCSSNQRCVDEWGLTGSCCPTLTGVFLDCCETVPDECQNGTGNCTLVSTREYVGSSAVRFQTAFIATLLSLGYVTLMA